MRKWIIILTLLATVIASGCIRQREKATVNHRMNQFRAVMVQTADMVEKAFEDGHLAPAKYLSIRDKWEKIRIEYDFLCDLEDGVDEAEMAKLKKKLEALRNEL